MKKRLKTTIYIVVGIIVVIVLVAGYLGFVPGLSDLMGAGPRDLGVRYTQQDLLSAQQKIGHTYTELPATTTGKTIQYSGAKDLKADFTNEELTALANSGKWKYGPAKDIQIKIGPDGTGEVSGRLMTGNLAEAGKVFGFSEQEVSDSGKYLGLIPGNPSFYMKGKASIQNNQVNIQPEKIEIGRIDTTKLVSAGEMESVFEKGIKAVPGMNIRSATLDNGKAQVDATMPDTIARVTE